MKEIIKEKLEENVLRQLNDAAGLAVGGELHQNAIEDIVSTVSTIQEIEKAEHEALVTEREKKHDAIIKNLEVGISAGTLGVAIAGFISREKWLRAGFELEKTGTFTVQTLKMLFSNMFKK